jgi:rubrerythrin
MISDLVDRLRVESKSMGKYGTDYMATLLMQASDTIIMLSEKARADRPQGEWKRVSADKYVQHAYHFYRCSKCGYDHIGKTNYCPNCGAKMKGTDDE